MYNFSLNCVHAQENENYGFIDLIWLYPCATFLNRSDIVCRPKYTNGLPDIPFDPKFITYPFEANRFVQYNATSLERNYKHELLAEHDLGVTIDLINPDTYRLPGKTTLIHLNFYAHSVYM